MRNPQISKNSQAGFTLLEVLIAATILAIMGLSIVTITNNSSDNKEKITAEDKEVLQLEMAFSIIEQDFSQIYSPLLFAIREKRNPAIDQNSPYENTYQGNERFAFATELGHPVPIYKFTSEGSLFEFFTSSNRRRMEGSKESNYAWVRYYLDAPKNDDEDSDNSVINSKSNSNSTAQETFSLYRAFSAKDPYAPERASLDKVKHYTLLEKITKWEWLFWSPKEKKFVDNINNIPNGIHNLKAIKIKMSWVDLQGSINDEERIFYRLWPEPQELKTLLSPSPNSANSPSSPDSSDSFDSPDFSDPLNSQPNPPVNNPLPINPNVGAP
jgi:prepilin-type N-terminal cleavage/methylation domain-containing protein